MAGSWLFECFDSSSFAMLEETASENTESTSTTTATEATPDDSDDRAHRKKSREKMRRNEVNDKVRVHGPGWPLRAY